MIRRSMFFSAALALSALTAAGAAAQPDPILPAPARPAPTPMPSKPMLPPDVPMPAKPMAAPMPLEGKLSWTVEPHYAPKFETRVESTIESKFESKFDSKFEYSGQYAVAPRYVDGKFVVGGAQERWYQGDPADSAYRAAYTVFSRQEYRSAADRFADVRAKYPSSRYFCDAAYYEAFARYRLGTPNDLRNGYKVLDGMTARCGESRREDVPELLARINGALARLGDNEASERVRRAASQGQSVCDREERNVKIQALSALAQMDPEGAKPILRNVLATRDVCTAPVRREALQLVARTTDAGSISTLLQTAKSDADDDTRMAAVDLLGRMQSDAAYAAIEDLLRTSTDERAQVAAARAMGQSDSPRAQASVRALAERKDVAERIRISVINSLGQRNNTPTDYWKSLYGKVESDELRRAVVNAVNRNSEDGQQYLLTIARNTSEPYNVRQTAVNRIWQTAPIADLYGIFQSADSRSLRQQIVSGLSSRKEAEATDRLIDIAKTGTDPEVRASAIRYLGQPARRDDPKVRKALADILGGQS